MTDQHPQTDNTQTPINPHNQSHHSQNSQNSQGILENFARISGLDPSRMVEDLFINWQQTLGSIKHSYTTATSDFIDEINITASQDDINNALYRFVVQNVDMVRDLKLEIHDGWLRLFATVNVMGIFATVASNFELVHLQLDKHTQRLVLKQISDTDIIELHSKKWWQATGAKFAVRAYRTILRKDPLPFILNAIKIKGVPFTEHKGNIIYLDIGRWLAKNKMIINTLRKIQINDAALAKEQLLLKAEPNFGEIFSLGDPNADIITPDDNPNKPQ